jgi:hypothetical protein
LSLSCLVVIDTNDPPYCRFCQFAGTGSRTRRESEAIWVQPWTTVTNAVVNLGTNERSRPPWDPSSKILPAELGNLRNAHRFSLSEAELGLLISGSISSRCNFYCKILGRSPDGPFALETERFDHD